VGSWAARWSQVAWTRRPQAHLETPAVTRRTLPSTSGQAREQRHTTARAAERTARAASRRCASAPARTSVRKLRLSQRLAAPLSAPARVARRGARSGAPSQEAAAGGADRRRSKTVAALAAWAPAPDGPLLAPACAWPAHAWDSVSRRSLLDW
jgi:hypothetical protein